MESHFEWNEDKAASNLKKHGVSFDDAILVFADLDRLEVQDRFENGEERWQTIGKAGDCMIILVAHTIRERGRAEVIRIISARKATKAERKRYEESKQ